MKKELSVYHTHTVFCAEIVMPEAYIGKFIIKFGVEFGKKDFATNVFSEKKVDDYGYHPNGWYVVVSVSEREKEKLAEFIEKFCQENALPIEDDMPLVAILK